MDDTDPVEHANPLQRLLARRRRAPLPRLSAEDERALLGDPIELQFRGKHVVAARTLVAFATRAQHIPGLMESAERVVDFFADPDSGHWVDGSELFRVARPDHSNRLKRFWRDLEQRKTTLRQYLERERSGDAEDDCVRFRLPESRFDSPKAFISAFRHIIAGLDRLCRLVMDEGFVVAGFGDGSGWILLRPESQDVLEFAGEVLRHHHWYREQREEVQTLEARKSISVEYANAAKSLAAAQLRHLGVKMQETVRDRLRGHPGERLETAVNMATEYVGILDAFIREGADVAYPRQDDDETRAA